MTWTYTDPATSTRDELRFMVGDTDTDDQLLSDEEIAYLLVAWINVPVAASKAASAIAARFSRLADKSVGELRISLSQKVASYRQLAVDLMRQAGAVCGPTTADQGDPLFKKAMMEQPATEEPEA